MTFYPFNISQSATEGIWKDQPGKHCLWCSFESFYLAIALKTKAKLES